MGAEVLKEAQREEKAMGEKLAGGKLREPYCYRVRYRDAGHDCQADICVTKSHGYGYDLRLTLGGYTFVGSNLCDFELEDPSQAEAAAREFCLMKWGGYVAYGDRIMPYAYALQRYSMEVEIPVEAERRDNGERIAGMIRFAYRMEACDSSRARSRCYCDDREIYLDDTICTEFSLAVDGHIYKADRPTTYFEQALSQICRKCGREYLLRCCFTCQYSDYSPYGCDDFGSMLCYREYKEVYLTVNDKAGYFDRLEGLDCEIEQETGVCGEFEERTRCEGYRGMVDGVGGIGT